MDFELEIRKTNVETRISIFEILCVPILRQNGQLWLFWPKFAQKWILGMEFWKTKSGCRISSSEISCVPIFRQNGQLWLFRLKFPQKKILGRNFKILSLDSKSAPPIHHECQFSGKTDNFDLFGLNLGKFPNYVRYFGSYNVVGVVESRVEAEMSWVEMEMSWVEVDGAEWRWMELGGGGCMV